MTKVAEAIAWSTILTIFCLGMYLMLFRYQWHPDPNCNVYGWSGGAPGYPHARYECQEWKTKEKPLKNPLF